MRDPGKVSNTESKGGLGYRPSGGQGCQHKATVGDSLSQALNPTSHSSECWGRFLYSSPSSPSLMVTVRLKKKKNYLEEVHTCVSLNYLKNGRVSPVWPVPSNFTEEAGNLDFGI